MKALIVLDGRPLNRAMNPQLGFTVIQRAIEGVADYALHLHHHHREYHNDEFINHLQQHYLELVEAGGLHRVIDHETGHANQAGWYEHYFEVAHYVVKYYLAELLGALSAISEEYGVSRLRLQRITPTHILVTAVCHVLIPDLRRTHEIHPHR